MNDKSVGNDLGFLMLCRHLRLCEHFLSTGTLVSRRLLSKPVEPEHSWGAESFTGVGATSPAWGCRGLGQGTQGVSPPAL